MKRVFLLLLPLFISACTSLETVGRVPAFTEGTETAEYSAMVNPDPTDTVKRRTPLDAASLWTQGRGSLLGDRRAAKPGDILTVVIEIDEEAEISNASARGRSGSESMGISSLFGLPQNFDNNILADGATLGSAVSTDSTSTFSGNGSVSRNEKLTLRIAATIVRVLPNGVLQIDGSQEVRVNFEVRELTVGGFVRPADISRKNEITYDKIASARISYGGRGQISQVQQPRYGQQIADIILPF
jgi:flagellar L-ring protein FlgH